MMAMDINEFRAAFMHPEVKDIVGIPMVFAIDEDGKRLEWPNKE